MKTASQILLVEGSGADPDSFRTSSTLVRLGHWADLLKLPAISKVASENMCHFAKHAVQVGLNKGLKDKLVGQNMATLRENTAKSETFSGAHM